MSFSKPGQCRKYKQNLLTRHSNSASDFIKKQAALAWTPHMGDCLKVLEDEMETPLDQMLVYHIKLQLIADELPKPPLVAVELPEHMRFVRDFQTKALLARVEEVRQKCPTDLPDDRKS